MYKVYYTDALLCGVSYKNETQNALGNLGLCAIMNKGDGGQASEISKEIGDLQVVGEERTWEATSC